MEFWLPLLGGAAGAAIINGLIALYKLRRDKNDEHSQWLRNQQLAAYVDFLDTCRDLENWTKSAHKIEPPSARRAEGVALVQSIKVTQLRLLAPKVTREGADLMLNHLLELGKVTSLAGVAPNTTDYQEAFQKYSDARAYVGPMFRKDFRAPK